MPTSRPRSRSMPRPSGGARNCSLVRMPAMSRRSPAKGSESTGNTLSLTGWQGDFAAGRRKAVADYFREVLARQRYPSDFPTGVKIAYLPAEQELVTDIDLPPLEAVPEIMSCEYLVTKRRSGTRHFPRPPETRSPARRRSACQSSRSLNTHGTICPTQPNSILSLASIPFRPSEPSRP